MRKMMFLTVLALGLAGGGQAVHAQQQQAAPVTTAADPAAQQAQMQSMIDRALPEQAAAVQMGIPPAQLNMSQMDMQQMGVGNYMTPPSGIMLEPGGARPRSGPKYKYTPRSPMDVGVPPRLFYNIPKRQ